MIRVLKQEMIKFEKNPVISCLIMCLIVNSMSWQIYCKKTLFQLILNCMSFHLFSENCKGNIFKFRAVWTGGTDKAKEGNFVWTNNNEKVEFQRWTPHKPHKADKLKNCIRLLVDGSWTDYFCSSPASFICEKILILNK